MVKVLERPPAELPDPGPGKVLHTWPPHARYMSDPLYYDTLGRDPFDQVKFWKLSDPAVRAEELEKILKEHLDHGKEYTDEHTEDEHRRQMMFTAAAKGAEDVLRALIKTGTKAHPEAKANEDQSCVPIFAAANHGHLGSVKLLIEEAGVSVEAKNEMGETPLLTAALAGEIEIVRYLLGEGADPRVRINPESEITQEYTPGQWAAANALELAASQGHMDIVKLLLEHPFYGSTRKRKNRDGEEDGIWVTPLALQGAAASRNFDMLKLLLERGAYPVEDDDGVTKGERLNNEREAIKGALPEAARLGDLETLKTLLSYFYPTDQQGNLKPFDLPENLHQDFVDGVFNTAMFDQPEKFEFLYSFDLKEPPKRSLNKLPEGMKLNLPRLLEIAAEHSALGMAKLLINKYNVDPNDMRRPPATTPLYTAASNKQTDMARYLLENHKIDLHKGHGRFITGPTPLWVAISIHAGDAAILLLQHGGPIEHIDDDLLDIDKPTKAVLVETATTRAPVRLIAEANAKERPLKNDRASRSSLLELDPETDKEWMKKLQQRKSDAELLEEEEESVDFGGNRFFRDLNREEEERLGHPKAEDEEDPKRRNPEFPTNKQREDEMHDTDWEPGLIFHDPEKDSAGAEVTS
ncbi:ankyrin [Viridothelium virens]|uniref:Ankyrin n=1 Tax=Viridothelium virens TaxID=1048519 RepID=A0A6A6H125_VIRVR|nr:ankyrin [Viridothelium virens]